MGLPARSAVLSALAVLAALPASAVAAPETEGTGEDMRHVANVPYPDANKDGLSEGTDLEFATLTVPEERVREVLRQDCRTVKRTVRSKGGKRRTVKRRSCRPVKDLVREQVGVQRRFALAGSYGDGLQLIDVTEPTAPKLVTTYACGISQGDVQVFTRQDLGGRTFVTYTADDGYEFDGKSTCAAEARALGHDLPAEVNETSGAGTYLVEVTNPLAPKLVSFIPVEQGSHNMTVHPNGKVLYNSNSDLITSFLPAIELIDIADPAKPQAIGEFDLLTLPGLGTESHDIGFNDDGTRAYVAALSHGEILDTTDPAKPSRVGFVVDPSLTVWHETEEITIDDPILGERQFLVAEDEVAGAAPTGQCPNGAVHVYDITGPLEQAPVKVGTWNIDDVGPTSNGVGTCTAHVFQLHEEQKLMTIAYYNGGVRVVDLSGLVGVALGRNGVGMREMGSFRFPDSDTWAVKTDRADRKGFFLYGNDQARGFDVYRWDPAGAARPSAGQWLTPAQAARRTARLRSSGRLELAAVCLLKGTSRSPLRSATRAAGLKLPAAPR